MKLNLTVVVLTATLFLPILYGHDHNCPIVAIFIFSLHFSHTSGSLNRNSSIQCFARRTCVSYSCMFTPTRLLFRHFFQIRSGRWCYNWSESTVQVSYLICWVLTPIVTGAFQWRSRKFPQYSSRFSSTLAKTSNAIISIVRFFISQSSNFFANFIVTLPTIQI